MLKKNKVMFASHQRESSIVFIMINLIKIEKKTYVGCGFNFFSISI